MPVVHFSRCSCKLSRRIRRINRDSTYQQIETDVYGSSRSSRKSWTHPRGDRVSVEQCRVCFAEGISSRERLEFRRKVARGGVPFNVPWNAQRRGTGILASFREFSRVLRRGFVSATEYMVDALRSASLAASYSAKLESERYDR